LKTCKTTIKNKEEAVGSGEYADDKTSFRNATFASAKTFFFGQKTFGVLKAHFIEDLQK